MLIPALTATPSTLYDINQDYSYIVKMRLYGFILFLILASCSSKPKVKVESKCFVSYDSLLKDVDTSKLQIVRNTDSAAIELSDKRSKLGEKGLFRFDYSGNLRLYTFLINDSNDTDFIIEYDSLGNHKRSVTRDVVEWHYFNRNDSSFNLDFFLCAIDYSYGKVHIKTGTFGQNVGLFESSFLKLIGGRVTIKYLQLDTTRKVYIRGVRQDKCTKVIQPFIDSITMPNVL